MKYLLFSDIHGNLPALEDMIERERAVDGYVNLGDVVNYAPWSNECVEIVAGLKNCYNIKGNHEQYFIDEYCDVKNDLVLDFFNECSKGFKHKDIIMQYSDEITLNGFRIIHTLNKKQYIFHDTELTLDDDTILGHSHQQYERTIGGNRLINPGSVGQNRKFINISNYAIWNLEENTFEFKAFKFDFDYLISEMKNKKYPANCIDYYTTKNKKD